MLGALKADPELCDIPVIMVTVAPDRGIGLSLGAAEVMTKPVDRAELTSLLRQLLSRDGPILVVEDDLATRETVRHTIEKMGLTVAEVTNGRLGTGLACGKSGACAHPARPDDAGDGRFRVPGHV